MEAASCQPPPTPVTALVYFALNYKDPAWTDLRFFIISNAAALSQLGSKKGGGRLSPRSPAWLRVRGGEPLLQNCWIPHSKDEPFCGGCYNSPRWKGKEALPSFLLHATKACIFRGGGLKKGRKGSVDYLPPNSRLAASCQGRASGVPPICQPLLQELLGLAAPL